MQPKARPPQCELFGARLSELLNPEHPLVVLAERIDWSEFDAAIDACYADELGRPGVNTRLMVGLLYLKHAFDESDESVVARWVENPYWQFFCGCSVHAARIANRSFELEPLAKAGRRRAAGEVIGGDDPHRAGHESGPAPRVSEGERRHDGPGKGDRLSDRCPTVSQDAAGASPPGRFRWASHFARTIVSRARSCWPGRAATPQRGR